MVQKKEQNPHYRVPECGERLEGKGAAPLEHLSKEREGAGQSCMEALSDLRTDGSR